MEKTQKAFNFLIEELKEEKEIIRSRRKVIEETEDEETQNKILEILTSRLKDCKEMQSFLKSKIAIYHLTPEQRDVYNKLFKVESLESLNYML